MASFKFYNIGAANAEITRLEQELATAQAAHAKKHTGDDACPECDGDGMVECEACGGSGKKSESKKASRLQEAIASNESLSTRITELTASESALRGQVAKLTTEIATLGTTHKTAMETLEKSVDERAAKKAAEIQAQLGAPQRAAQPAGDKTLAAGADSGINRVLAAARQDLQAAGYARKN